MGQRITRRYRGFSLVELLVALLITMIGISGCFKMLQVINLRAYSLADREGFEAASNAALQISADLERAGVGIRSLADAWLCHVLSQDQFNQDHYTLLAPFLFVRDDALGAANPWVRSDVIMSEYGSYYPIFPRRTVYSTSDGHQVILDDLSDTNFDPAVGLLTGYNDSAATSGFARPCIMTQKTKVKIAGNFYYFEPQISGPTEYTLTPADTQSLLTNRTDELANYMPSWARTGGLPGGLHPQEWRSTTLVQPSKHTIISPHLPNFIAWSVEPQTGFLRRKNMLNNSDAGCMSDLVVALRGQYLIRDGSSFSWQDANTMTQFLTGSATNPGSLVSPVDFSKVVALRIVVLARNGTYIPDADYQSDIPSWESGYSFDMGPTNNSMPGSGVTVATDHTNWRHYEWEIAQFIVPVDPVAGWTYTK